MLAEGTLKLNHLNYLLVSGLVYKQMNYFVIKFKNIVLFVYKFKDNYLICLEVQFVVTIIIIVSKFL